MPEFKDGEPVMVYNDQGQYIWGRIHGEPPEDPAALVAVNAPGPGGRWVVVWRERSEVRDYPRSVLGPLRGPPE